MLGLHSCPQAFPSCGEGGLLFVAGHGLLTAVASLVVGHRLQVCRLSSCGARILEHRLHSYATWAELLRGTWDLPRPGIEPMSPALKGRISSTEPPGKHFVSFLLGFLFCLFHVIVVVFIIFFQVCDFLVDHGKCSWNKEKKIKAL